MNSIKYMSKYGNFKKRIIFAFIEYFYHVQYGY